MLNHKIFLSHAMVCSILLTPVSCISTPQQNPQKESLCTIGNAVETDGYRRLALIVAVGKYKNNKINSLLGPPNDARRFYELLTSKNGGYEFPKENVCLLLDEDATTARFKEAFEKTLVERAREKDVAVFYFAGHGSQARDRNGDEPDQWDETLMFHDARTPGVGDLVDDELNTMLARLGSKTKNIVVIFDSCNSGTADRGPSAGTFIARFQPPDDTGETERAGVGAGDGGAGWVPETIPGMVVFSAATDGTSALERGGRGVFTDAILDVLGQVSSQPLTYAQAARQIPEKVSAAAHQISSIRGDLDRPVFGNTKRARPVSWEVISLGPPIKLGGPPIPGVGKGAELRIYDGATTKADTKDPKKAKATVVIDKMTGLNAFAHISAARPDAPGVAVGDLAVLVRPADAAFIIKVRLRPEKEPGGIPKGHAAALEELIKKDDDAKLAIELTEGPGDFELSLTSRGRLQLRGPENRVRKEYETDNGVPRNLWRHARQRALLQLHGEGGADFRDNETLQVQLVPASKQSSCAKINQWEQQDFNKEQIIPLCISWNVKVTLSKTSPFPLLVGGVVLSTDGDTFGFPVDGRKELLKPGKSVTFRAQGETFRGSLPLDIQDRVIVFGTQESNPVQWNLLTDTARARSGGPPKSTLHRALDRYITAGARGQAQRFDDVEDTTWTLSTVPIRVRANLRFEPPDPKSDRPAQREYTIKNFDIRPYLPDNSESALYKVLKVADGLASYSVTDGVGYKQHAWKEPTDAANLKKGIDCSRSIWFAFTRAGLTYNQGDRYITTADMVRANGPMKDYFDSCSGGPGLQIGDILVYRDKQRGDGHTVMVIDPERRIAWGSHGWDGNAKELKVEPDTGVEYQLIKYKKDWQRWDRQTMERQACWRYRQIAQEALLPHGQAGIEALGDPCDEKKQCSQMENDFYTKLRQGG
jgi:hypothetical protein